MVQVPDNKKYFRIGEASRIVGVETYVLRFWESEFPQIKPQRADSKQRTYQKKDLETLLEIKRLLYEEKMTIEGAKKRLKKKKDRIVVADRQFLDGIKTELREIVDMMS